MANKLGLAFAAKTDIGLARSRNEDAIAHDAACGFAIVADGMGGYNAGEVASRMAIDAMSSALRTGLRQLREQPPGLRANHSRQLRHLLTDAVQRANAAVVEAARAHPQYRGMGTTLVAALFHRDGVILAHVGDSRAYRFRHGRLEQLTRDHSLLQDEIDAGLISPEAARFSPHKNFVTRAVGVDESVEADICDFRTEPGDVYLLCSDGLSDMLPPDEISAILLGCSPALDAACGKLVRQANDNGGHDNISAILVRIDPDNTRTEGLLGRIRRRIA
jgi:protein phosphatase